MVQKKRKYLLISIVFILWQNILSASETIPGLKDSQLPEGVTAPWWEKVRDEIERDNVEIMQSANALHRDKDRAAFRGITTSPAWSQTGESTNTEYGESVASAGDVNGDGYSDVIVGSIRYNNYTGKVYLYYGSPSGLSTSCAWSAVGEDQLHNFGSSVASAGDINGDGYADVLVGAERFYEPGTTDFDKGKVYLYLGSATGLPPSHSWHNWGSTGEYLGAVVAPAGDVNGDGYADFMIAAPKAYSEAGKVFIYLGDPSGYPVHNQTLSSIQANSHLGESCASAGDVNGDGYSDVIIGIPGGDSNGTDSGLVQLYRGSASGTLQISHWGAAGEGAAHYFGCSVSLAGDINGDGYPDVVIGAKGYDSNRGKVYIYAGSVNGLLNSPSWTAIGADGMQIQFGNTVSTAGDINGDGYADILVGSCGNYPGGYLAKASLFYGGPSWPSVPSDWTITESAWNGFSRSLATAGDVNGDGYSDIIIGSPCYNADSYQGMAELWLGGPRTASASWNMTLTGSVGNLYLGYSVASAGDVNGDGFGDVIVGAYGYVSHSGRAYLYPGSPTGLQTTSVWEVTPSYSYDEFGKSVASAGDVNGDGYSDIIIGAPKKGIYDDTGGVYGYYGSATWPATTEDWFLEGETDDSLFGCAVASAGDVNGDGYGDILIGAYGYTSNTGKAYIYLGSSSGILPQGATPFREVQGEATEHFFGASVASAGDVNRDGYSDIIIGAYGFDDISYTDRGKSYLYLGSATGPSSVADWTSVGENADDLFGISVAPAGDCQGDGYSDVAVGASGYNDSAGKVYVFNGSSGGLSPSASWTAMGENIGDLFGNSVASAGDVNGDGYSDLVVGASGYNSLNGKIYLFHGSTAGHSGVANWSSQAENWDNSKLGRCVSGAVDIDGNGASEIIAAAPSLGASVGRVYVFHGNGTVGRPIVLSQFQDDGTTPIPLLGAMQSDTFVIQMKGFSPFGLGKVKLEWEIKPLSLLLDGTETTTSTNWTDTGVSGATLIAESPALCSGPYHWQARILYSPIVSPWLQNGPWMSIQDNALQETRLRSSHFPDNDNDDVCDLEDNCPLISNPDQLDSDSDGHGDLCDNCPDDMNTEQIDTDNDDIGDVCDNCPLDYNVDQNDMDDDTVGDVCDNCPDMENTDQDDDDSDTVGDVCDNCPDEPNENQTDGDSDGLGDACDNCPARANPEQDDTDLLESVSYWRFDEGSGSNAADSAGSNDGTVSGATWDTGKIGTALRFDESSTVTVPDSPTLDLTGSLCIVAWVRPEIGYGHEDYNHIALVSRWGAAGNGNAAYLMAINSLGNVKFYLHDGSSSSVLTSSNTIPEETWTHVAVVRDEDTMRIYINGIADTSTASGSVAAQNSTYGIYLGRESGGNSGFKGLLDEVALFDRALCDSEIMDIVDNSIYHAHAQDGWGDVCDNCPQIYNPAQENADGDALGDACDCDSGNNLLWSAPSAASNLRMTRQSEGTLTWDAPELPGCQTPVYDVLRSTLPDNFSAADCIATNITTRTTIDASNPASVYYYLVRVENGCGSNLSIDSDGTERVGKNCP